MNPDSRIYVAGHTGLVGSAIVRRLRFLGYKNIIERRVDLLDEEATWSFMNTERPTHVFMAAARCGGIIDNMNYPVKYILDNLRMQNNIIECAWKTDVERLLFLGSSCIYPKDCEQPIREEHLLTGKPEETNEFYAIAKIAGIKLCQAFNKEYKTKFLSINPCNIYGPGDKFGATGHVIGALIQKFVSAKSDDVVEIFGDGTARREFLHVDDLADACVFLIQNQTTDILNVGSGEDVTIKTLVNMIKDIVKYNGEIYWNNRGPVGMMRKCLDVSELHKLGWKHSINLYDGLKTTISWYKEQL